VTTLYVAHTSDFWRRYIFLHNLFSQVFIVLGKKRWMTYVQHIDNQNDVNLSLNLDDIKKFKNWN